MDWLTDPTLIPPEAVLWATRASLLTIPLLLLYLLVRFVQPLSDKTEAYTVAVLLMLWQITVWCHWPRFGFILPYFLVGGLQVAHRLCHRDGIGIWTRQIREPVFFVLGLQLLGALWLAPHVAGPFQAGIAVSLLIELAVANWWIGTVYRTATRERTAALLRALGMYLPGTAVVTHDPLGQASYIDPKAYALGEGPETTFDLRKKKMKRRAKEPKPGEY